MGALHKINKGNQIHNPTTVLIANPKGGSGKTTLATNLACLLANSGYEVKLWDLDPQKSSTKWLALRGDKFPKIGGMGEVGEIKRNYDNRDRSGFVIIDSPAGMQSKTLKRALKLAKKVIIPVQPSMFDLTAADGFINALAVEGRNRHDNDFFGIVGMRVDARTRTAATLRLFLEQYNVPILTYIKDTQMYANAAFRGLGLCDLSPSMKEEEEQKWRLLLEWIAKD